jgi:hypothetical protein
MASNADHPRTATNCSLPWRSSAHGHEKALGYGQLGSLLVAAKVPACGHGHTRSIGWVCGLCDANVCPHCANPDPAAAVARTVHTGSANP